MTAPIRVAPGSLLIFEQQDYCYGTGKLRLLLPRGGVVPDGVEWLPVRGTEIGWDREPRGERYALVRAEAIPAALAAGERCGAFPRRRSFLTASYDPGTTLGARSRAAGQRRTR